MIIGGQRHGFLRPRWSGPLFSGFTGTPISEIVSVEILGDVRVPDPAGDGQQGTKGNGWVAKVTTPFHVSQNFDPTKLIFSTTGPGFTDASGAERLVTRTFRGREKIRLQFVQGSSPPSNTLRLANQVGVNLEVYISLAECVYSGEALTVTAEDGFYGPGSVGGPVATITQGSVRLHQEPQCCFLDYPGRVVGTSYTIEAMAFSIFARSGQQVAAIGFYAKDSSGNVTPEVRVGATVLSNVVNGQVAGCARPEVFRAVVDTSNLHQGDTCNFFMNIYPWVGPMWSMEANGVLFPSPRADAALRFVADPGNVYGGVYAYVQAGATGGAVSLSAATARTTPYPTVSAALVGIQAFNAAPGGGRTVHNDIGGAFVRLMDNAGAAQVHLLNTSTSGRAGGVGFCTIEADPLNTAAVSISNPTANTPVVSGLRFRVPVDFTGGGNWDTSNANSYIIYDGAPVTAAGTYPNYKINGAHYLNVAFGGTSGRAVSQSFNNNAQVGLLAGCSAIGTLVATAAATICNFFTGMSWGLNVFSNNPPINNGAVFYNNRLMKMGTTGGGVTDSVRGVAVIQNVLEGVFIGSCMRFSGDNSLAPVTNLNMQLNTVPGPSATGGDGCARINLCYADVLGSANITKEAVMLFNNWNNTNTKADTFDGTIVDPTGRTGNYFTLYRVGSKGNVTLKSNHGGTDFAFDPDGGVAGSSGGNWLGMVSGVGDKTGVSMAFVDNKSANTAGGPGGGDYHLAPLAGGVTNPAIGMIPAGQSPLKYDIGGTLRKTDGTGAAGAYEG